MIKPHRRPDDFFAARAATQSLERLQLEMALEARNGGILPLEDLMAEAATAAGCELLFVLPTPDGRGTNAVVRLAEENGIDSFLQAAVAGERFAVSEQAEMDQALLRLARAFVDVFGRLADDQAIGPPLAAVE